MTVISLAVPEQFVPPLRRDDDGGCKAVPGDDRGLSADLGVVDNGPEFLAGRLDAQFGPVGHASECKTMLSL